MDKIEKLQEENKKLRQQLLNKDKQHKEAVKNLMWMHREIRGMDQLRTISHFSNSKLIK